MARITKTKCYFELRKQSARGTDSVAADMMRHLHARQHLGKAAVICDQPVVLLAAARKQWLKLGRTIQKQRASTLNADKILKYTHTITHMQHMRFTTKSPLEELGADVYFLEEKDCKTMPLDCYSLYYSASFSDQTTLEIIEQLPAEALVIDYAHQTPWAAFGLQPKSVLEERVGREWNQVRQFLTGRGISIRELIQEGTHNIEAMDDALDTLLAASNQFLRIANDFQRALELARPLRVQRRTREQYDSLVLLAYRVQALSPGIFSQRFLESYNEDDTFFLYDLGKRSLRHRGDPLAAAIDRHLAAGRKHLARSLRHILNAK